MDGRHRHRSRGIHTVYELTHTEMPNTAVADCEEQGQDDSFGRDTSIIDGHYRPLCLYIWPSLFLSQYWGWKKAFYFVVVVTFHHQFLHLLPSPHNVDIFTTSFLYLILIGVKKGALGGYTHARTHTNTYRQTLSVSISCI